MGPIIIALCIVVGAGGFLMGYRVARQTWESNRAELRATREALRKTAENAEEEWTVRYEAGYEEGMREWLKENQMRAEALAELKAVKDELRGIKERRSLGGQKSWAKRKGVPCHDLQPEVSEDVVA